MLAIHLLGQFEVRVDDVEVKIASRPAQALLSYLVLTAGNSHRREKIAGLLWPEATEDNARTYLRQAIWRLRKAIGESYFLADRVTVAFNADADHWSDVKQLETKPEGGWTADSLIEAVSVYKGELLPGFYDDWVSLERERLLAIYTRRIDALVTNLVEESRWRDVIHWGEEWIATGSAPEPAYRALMKAHAALADRTSMSAVYRRCVEALRAELQVEPSEETRSLFQRLSQGEELQIESTPPGSLPAEMGEEKLLPAFLTGQKPPIPRRKHPFVGREGELEALDQKLQKAIAGRGLVTFISGEAGIGKTALLHEFSRRSQAAYPKLIVARGTCPVNTGVSAPYVPFQEILEMLAGDLESAWRAGRIDRDHASRLWNMFPETLTALIEHGPNLVDTFVSETELERQAKAASISQDRLNRLSALVGRIGPDSSRPAEQRELFADFASVIGALAAQNPLLLILDDLQWADRSSIGLLAHLSHRLAGSSILLVGAYRPEDLGQAAEYEPQPFVKVLSELKRQFGEIQIELSERWT